jgi:hypothetical protein
MRVREMNSGTRPTRASAACGYRGRTAAGHGGVLREGGLRAQRCGRGCAWAMAGRASTIGPGVRRLVVIDGGPRSTGTHSPPTGSAVRDHPIAQCRYASIHCARPRAAARAGKIQSPDRLADPATLQIATIPPWRSSTRRTVTSTPSTCVANGIPGCPRPRSPHRQEHPAQSGSMNPPRQCASPQVSLRPAIHGPAQHAHRRGKELSMQERRDERMLAEGIDVLAAAITDVRPG